MLPGTIKKSPNAKKRNQNYQKSMTQLLIYQNPRKVHVPRHFALECSGADTSTWVEYMYFAFLALNKRMHLVENQRCFNFCSILQKLL